MLSNLYTPSPLTITNILCCRYYCPYFTDEETEALRSEGVQKEVEMFIQDNRASKLQRQDQTLSLSDCKF